MLWRGPFHSVDGVRIMERLEMERQQAISGIRDKIRRVYEQIKRGETVDARDVLAGIKAMSKAAREGTKKSK
jgi:hypothetical protein